MSPQQPERYPGEKRRAVPYQKTMPQCTVIAEHTAPPRNDICWIFPHTRFRTTDTLPLWTGGLRWVLWFGLFFQAWVKVLLISPDFLFMYLRQKKCWLIRPIVVVSYGGGTILNPKSTWRSLNMIIGGSLFRHRQWHGTIRGQGFVQRFEQWKRSNKSRWEREEDDGWHWINMRSYEQKRKRQRIALKPYEII